MAMMKKLCGFFSRSRSRCRQLVGAHQAIKRSDSPGTVFLHLRLRSDTVGLKLAYYELARKWHPDLNRDLDAKYKFQKLQEAYALLKQAKRCNHSSNKVFPKMQPKLLEAHKLNSSLKVYTVFPKMQPKLPHKFLKHLKLNSSIKLYTVFSCNQLFKMILKAYKHFCGSILKLMLIFGAIELTPLLCLEISLYAHYVYHAQAPNFYKSTANAFSICDDFYMKYKPKIKLPKLPKMMGSLVEYLFGAELIPWADHPICVFILSFYALIQEKSIGYMQYREDFYGQMEKGKDY